jgi:dienelactone hydrolase
MRPCREFVAHRSAVLGALAVLLVTAVGVAGDDADVMRTWEQARIFLPGSAVPFKPSKVPATHRQLTTVLYLHGCTGFDYSHDGTMGGWAETLTAAGYAVVMSTSFAREYRPRNCDQTTYTSGLAMEVMDMRLEEIEYALKQMRTLSWVDQRNLFLMGHSEGGVTTARWGGREFNGHIISGWTCTAPTFPSFDGVRAPLATPVLAISFESDPWWQGPYAGSCASKFGARKDSRQVTLPGWGHGTASHQEARAAVLQFIRDHSIP